MSTTQDDTQALRPLAPQAARRPGHAPGRGRPAARRDRRACLYQALAALALLLLAALVVALAGLAGWTAGHQEALNLIAVTQAARVRDQLARIPADVAAGNAQLLAARLEFLAEVTPAVPQLPQLRLTANALARPTAAFTPAAPAITETVVAPQTVQWRPEELLRQARAAIGSGEYEEGVDLLQALEALAPDYEPAAVRELILSALTKQAGRLFRSGDSLAQAILLTDEAVRYGLAANSALRYERHVAALYLDARSQMSRGPAAAIPALRALYDVAPGYRNGEVRRLLVEQHATWAEQLLTQGDACAALEQLQQALALRADAALALRRDEAARGCGQGPTLPVSPAPAGATLAPGAYIGVAGRDG